MVSIAGAGRRGMAVVSSAGMALLAARVASASARPLSSAGGIKYQGQVAQVDQGLLGSPVGGVNQLADLRAGIVAELLPGHAEVHGEGGQPDLRAVVQVPLEKQAQGGGGAVHRQRPGLLQVGDPLRQPSRPEQAAHEPAVRRADRPGRHGAAGVIAAPAAKAANVPGNVSMRSAPNGVSA